MHNHSEQAETLTIVAPTALQKVLFVSGIYMLITLYQVQSVSVSSVVSVLLLIQCEQRCFGININTV